MSKFFAFFSFRRHFFVFEPKTSGMPRLARQILPGSFLHLIVRFHNKQYLMPDDEARAVYRKAIRLSLAKWDSQIFSYARMSTHIHFENTSR